MEKHKLSQPPLKINFKKQFVYTIIFTEAVDDYSKKNEAIVKIICIVEIVGPNEVYLYKGVFSSENFWLLAIVALSFVFGKNYLTMDYLDLKDSSHDFSANYVISFFLSTFSTPCICRKIRCENL